MSGCDKRTQFTIFLHGVSLNFFLGESLCSQCIEKF